jgi:hypothetical protein
MKTKLTEFETQAQARRRRQQGQTRSALLAVVSFVLGIAVSALWVHWSGKPGKADAPADGGSASAKSGSQTAPPVATPPVPPPPAPKPPPPADPAIAEEIKRVIPNATALTAAEGKRLLTEAAFKEFTAVANERKAQIAEAEQRYLQAQTGGSEAEKQETLRQLQQARAAQAEKLNQIADRLAAQIAVWNQLKAAEGANPPGAK